MATATKPKARVAGMGLRLLASAYDSVILFGVIFAVYIPITWIEQRYGEIPNVWKQMLLMAVAYAYFVGFWSKGGATTGMRPWQLRVAMSDSGNPLGLATATARFMVLMLTWLALGLTFIYLSAQATTQPYYLLAAIIPAASLVSMLFSRNNQTLHDLVSGTTIFRVKQQ
ncbi:MAG: RDD family protein [Mariprofundaceae bacterium]